MSMLEASSSSTQVTWEELDKCDNEELKEKITKMTPEELSYLCRPFFKEMQQTIRKNLSSIDRVMNVLNNEEQPVLQACFLKCIEEFNQSFSRVVSHIDESADVLIEELVSKDTDFKTLIPSLCKKEKWNLVRKIVSKYPETAEVVDGKILEESALLLLKDPHNVKIRYEMMQCPEEKLREKLTEMTPEEFSSFIRTLFEPDFVEAYQENMPGFIKNILFNLPKNLFSPFECFMLFTALKPYEKDQGADFTFFDFLIPIFMKNEEFFDFIAGFNSGENCKVNPFQRKVDLLDDLIDKLDKSKYEGAQEEALVTARDKLLNSEPSILEKTWKGEFSSSLFRHLLGFSENRLRVVLGYYKKALSEENYKTFFSNHCYELIQTIRMYKPELIDVIKEEMHALGLTFIWVCNKNADGQLAPHNCIHLKLWPHLETEGRRAFIKESSWKLISERDRFEVMKFCEIIGKKYVKKILFRRREIEGKKQFLYQYLSHRDDQDQYMKLKLLFKNLSAKDTVELLTKPNAEWSEATPTCREFLDKVLADAKKELGIEEEVVVVDEGQASSSDSVPLTLVPKKKGFFGRFKKA